MWLYNIHVVTCVVFIWILSIQTAHVGIKFSGLCALRIIKTYYINPYFKRLL